MEKNSAETRDPRRASNGRIHSPTREQLLRILEAQTGPASVTALAKISGWHENTVRGHLNALWADGYLDRVRDESRHGQGRPCWLWQAIDRSPRNPYAALAVTLAETLAQSHPDPVVAAREAGVTWGRSLVDTEGEWGPRSTAETADLVWETMREQGFAPERHGDDLMLLKQCPLIEAASSHTQIVCAVHLGMIAGVIDAAGMKDNGSRLTPFSDPGTCRLDLRITSEK